MWCVNEEEIKEYWVNKSNTVFSYVRLALSVSAHLNAPREELKTLWEKNRKG